MEGALEQFKTNYPEIKIPQEYENKILNVYKEFLDIFKKSSLYKLKLYFSDFTRLKGNFLDVRAEIVDIKEKDKETPEKRNGYTLMLNSKRALIAIKGFVLLEKESKRFLIPFRQLWDSMNYINQYIQNLSNEDWKENLENEFYGFGEFNFSTSIDPSGRNDYIEVTRKKFNLDMIPKKAFDLLKDINSIPKNKEELYKILEDITTSKFEDTIKSERVGRVLSRL